VDVPSSLEAFRARLDEELGSLVWWGAASPWQGVGTGWSFKSLPIHHSVIYVCPWLGFSLWA